jgi:L-malate glycosyltransferase
MQLPIFEAPVTDPYVNPKKAMIAEAIMRVKPCRKVVIVNRTLHQYRKDFLELLRPALAARGVALTFVYGKYPHSSKKDQVDLDWGIYLPSKFFRFRNLELVWQPCMAYLKDQDLIIVEQANRNLINYYLMLRRALGFQGPGSKKTPPLPEHPEAHRRQRLAFWGHGRNLQANATDVRNRFKRFFLQQCDWWFAYTETVKQDLIQSSFPSERITNVQNAINTRTLSEHYVSISETYIAALKQQLGIRSRRIGLYCGGIYKEKRIPFLLQAVDQIRAQVPDFHFLVIGSGPDAHLIEEAQRSRPWIHFIGPVFGLERVIYFKLASLFLMPGLVGLAILDSFAMRTPMVTTAFPFHSPEIEYLKNGINGVITPNTLEAYVGAVVQLLQNESDRLKLAQACEQSATQYTLEQMVANFVEGVIEALQIPPASTAF